MKGRKDLFIIFLTFLLTAVLFMTSIHIGFTRADSTTPTFYVSPQRVSASPMSSFTLDVKIRNVYLMTEYEVHLDWNPAVLNLTSVTKGTFLSNSSQIPTNFYKVINYANGTLGCIETQVPAKLENGVGTGTGNATLFTSTFTVLSTGQCTLHFHDTHILYVYSDIGNVAEDGYFSNQPVHDVAVTNVTTCKDGANKPFPIVGRYCLMDINVTVENQGDYSETFNVTLYANSTMINQTQVTLLNATFTVLAVTWNATLPYGNYTINAIAGTVAEETDTADNAFTGIMVLVTIAGDLNGDYRVTGPDLNTLLISYGSPINPSRPYNPNCDIAQDDHKVDPKDLNLLLSHYGWHYP